MMRPTLRSLACSLRRASFLSMMALSSAAAVGCSDVGSTTDDVTDIKHTPVKDQSIGNCWVYASLGWAESLRYSYSGEAPNYSESWVSYWHWYEGILAGKLEEGKVSTGGFFGEAAEILRKYGVMDEAAFIPEEANSAESSRQSQALSALNASLASGALKDPKSRKDRALVRAELDKAWKLSAPVVGHMDAVFGKDVSKNLTSTSVSIPTGFAGHVRAADIQVGLYTNPSGGAQKVITLADAIGMPASSWDVRTRTGEFAWTSVNYPSSASSRRSFLRRMQENLHAGFPVIMTWFVDFNAMNKSDGTFKAPPATIGRQGGHMTVIEDYQVNNVPGYGTLKAGETVTDPAILQAALSPEASLEFIRIKNSWGSELTPPGGTAGLGGYHDLYMKYLDGPIASCERKNEATGDCLEKRDNIGLWAMVYPSDKWKNVTFQSPAPPPPPPPPSECSHDLCVNGTTIDTACNDPCVDLVCSEDAFCCNTKWDATCVSTASYVCDLACQ
jgi:hypothetical protein